MYGICLVYLLTLCYSLAKDPPSVVIPGQGTIQGKEISLIRTQRILAYLAIPYANPPVGDLRFAPPVTDPMPSWEGVRNGSEHAPACLQTDKDYVSSELPFLHLISDLNFEVDEDCLYLNVFVPFGNSPPGGFATIVWIHPGNFRSGSPSIWNPYTLVFRQRVIVVTVAYRLNIFGFFTTMDGEAPGNFGLMDQRAALMWVKNNIKYFDGNPDNITLMGYGSGGTSVGFHLLNQQSSQYFSKAIIMSSNIFSSSTVKHPHEEKYILNSLAYEFTCDRMPTSNLIQCLRRLTGQDLLIHVSHLKGDWKPIVDKGLSNSTQPFIPDLPKNTFALGEYLKVPLLIGYTNMEQVLAVEGMDSNSEGEQKMSEDYVPSMLSTLIGKDLPTVDENSSCVYNLNHLTDSVKFFYGPSSPIIEEDQAKKLIADFMTEKNYGSSTYLQAMYMSKEQPTYVYRFDMKPSTKQVIKDLPEWVTVPHLFDLIYIWGIPYWTNLKDQDWDIRDKRTSDIIMSFWTSFAKNGNPTESSSVPIKWEPFTKESPGILIIDKAFNMSDISRINLKSFDFWNNYYPKVVDIATQCCNATEPDSSQASIEFNPFLLLLVGLTFSSKHL